MASIPQTPARRAFKRPSWPIIVAAVLIVALMAMVVWRFAAGRAAPTEAGTPVDVTRGPLVASITATGKVEPVRAADLAFAAREGRVAQVLVNAGDTVPANAELVKLDARQLEAAVAAARAVLAQAQADLAGLRAGATPEETDAARAQVAAAQGALRQTQGAVTAADLQAARQQVEEARARLATLQNPGADDLTRVRAALTEARANLDRQGSTLAVAKEQANRAVEARANDLRNAQAAYDQALRDRQRALDDDRDPRTGAPLTDSGREAYVNAAAQAERSMSDADSALTQARVDYDNARQLETAGLADAQAKLDSAQADLNGLLNPSAENLAAARTALASAEARLAQLTGDQRAGALAAQQANVQNAQAQLDKLLADPKASELARAEAQVAQAQAQLDQAQINLDDATLRAPFAGTVGTVNVAPGEQIGTTPPATLIDTSRFVVKGTVDEVDVSQVSVGQPVNVVIDALGGEPLVGTVRRIAPQSQPGSAVTAYEVTIEVDPAGRPVRSGMTATASIVTESRENALRAPAQAVRTENGKTVVSVVTTENGRQQVSTQPIETGLRAGDQIEIRSGLNEGQQVLVK